MEKGPFPVDKGRPPMNEGPFVQTGTLLAGQNGGFAESQGAERMQPRLRQARNAGLEGRLEGPVECLSVRAVDRGVSW